MGHPVYYHQQSLLIIVAFTYYWVFWEVKPHIFVFVCRLLDIISNKIFQVFPEDTPIENLTMQGAKMYRLEVSNSIEYS